MTLISAVSEDSCFHEASGSIVFGRLLHFSPNWVCSNAAVVFDRNSGDYWVVSSLAGLVLKLLVDHSVLTYRDLEQALDFTTPNGVSITDLLPTLKSLVDNGLVKPNPSLAMLVAESLNDTDD